MLFGLGRLKQLSLPLSGGKVARNLDGGGLRFFACIFVIGESRKEICPLCFLCFGALRVFEIISKTRRWPMEQRDHRMMLCFFYKLSRPKTHMNSEIASASPKTFRPSLTNPCLPLFSKHEGTRTHWQDDQPEGARSQKGVTRGTPGQRMQKWGVHFFYEGRILYRTKRKTKKLGSKHLLRLPRMQT